MFTEFAKYHVRTDLRAVRVENDAGVHPKTDARVHQKTKDGCASGRCPVNAERVRCPGVQVTY
jgi:hypothetical protein